MRNATLQLRKLINSGAIDKKLFTQKQLNDINTDVGGKAKTKIHGYAWHHNAQSSPNNMQLIPDEIHNKAVRHTGEGSLSEGR
ncbi:HNH endonuclease [Moraxella lacunata]